MKIVNKKYNIGNKLNKNIVLISDIHYYSKKDIKHLNKVLDKIKKISPNYICISGDIIDKSKVFDLELLINWLRKLSTICKVIIVLGNHEFYIDKKNNIYELSKDYIDSVKKINNLYLLNNENIIFDNINFIGLTLPIEHYTNKQESKEDFTKYIKNIKTNKNCYNILLCHSPVNICNEKILSKINIDLALCGHMHGGLIPQGLRFIFKQRGLLSPQKKLFPNNVYGKIVYNNKNIIITSGIKVLSESHCKYFKSVFSSEIVEIKF